MIQIVMENNDISPCLDMRHHITCACLRLLLPWFCLSVYPPPLSGCSVTAAARCYQVMPIALEVLTDDRGRGKEAKSVLISVQGFANSQKNWRHNDDENGRERN